MKIEDLSINTGANKQVLQAASLVCPLLLHPSPATSFHSPPTMAAAAASAGTIRQAEEVNKEIQEYYHDTTSLTWEKMWGDHVHTGFYDPGVTAPSPAENRAALVRTVEEALRFAGISDDPEKRPKRIVDVGCGIGGSSFYLAKRYGAQCDGININPTQIERARARAAAEGLEDKVNFHLGDAMQQPFPDGHFDLVWCMDVIDHMTDREKFFRELVRVAAPGATIIITSVCRRDPEEKPFTPDEVVLLKRICEGLHHASWFTVPGYINIAESLPLKDIKTADWSENIIPFWQTALQTAMSLEGSTILLESAGMALIKAVLTAPTIVESLKNKLINYSIITFRKL
ncbi:hypothetical protein Taro_003694 [Colocasia esculenta]|uniref:Methyltransferase type 11 domain-containing protein n=1 Tax=Colocasia esculenta TaxID=4460 RepID=A0A843TME5_COLES|nr:hypothetical protein [Colocasia esculenta]